MGDQFRSKVEQYSPKSSPRGARSPVVSRQDSTGTLKTTISLGKNPSIVHSGPFYLMKEPPGGYFYLFRLFFLLIGLSNSQKFNILTSLSLWNYAKTGAVFLLALVWAQFFFLFLFYLD